ncbi:type 1 glutamine amidotransferase [Ramlibacter sp. XY19]|uniref:type 1 glutamine amidotransferase domain-containing protein n=1 Tax=Ramlibacter paludis TaxID=2908000 RepID=UPI0023DAD858|nr:type 1 glutamine amidotransferase domain-containing protein [Ramlibacter paludis]MCG2592350.1 type 1 glutamine amidotransferase [Ramlibacter paludis]
MAQQQQQTLSGRKVAILTTDGFEQVELTGPRDALQAAGATTTIVAMNPGQVQGFHHDKPADKFDVGLTLAQAKPDDFDAVLLPGGVMNADKLRNSQHAQEFVQAMQKAGKPIAAICHAPWLLISAGLVKGRKMTSWPSLQDDLRNAGAQWVDEEVVKDGNWVTSRKPADIPAFSKAAIELIAARK